MVWARFLLRSMAPSLIASVSALVAAVQLIGGLALFRPKLLWMKRSDFIRCLILGSCGFAAGSWLVNTAIQKTSAATAVTLQYFAPAIALCYDRIRGTEKLNCLKIIALVCTLIGCALTAGAVDKGLKIHLGGAMCAIGAAFTFAFITIFSKPLSEKYNPLVFTGYTFVASTAILLMLPGGHDFSGLIANPRFGLQVLVFAAVFSVIPTVLFLAGLRTVSPTAAGIICSSEIAVASVLAWVILGEKMSLWQILGALLVFTAVVLIERSREDVGSVKQDETAGAPHDEGTPTRS